jgi:putative intracellular protease/amidase
MNKAKILVYISSATQVPHREGTSHEVGVFLGELVEPLMPLYKAGHHLDFVSPDGNTCTIDKGSFNLMYWRFSIKRLNISKGFLKILTRLGMHRPMKLSDLLQNDVLLNSYDVLFIPGGHAPMTDVLHVNWMKGNEYNRDTGNLLLHFHQNNKPTATICHGGAALAAAPDIDGLWAYANYRMTCVSMLAEKLVEDVPFFRLGGHLPDYPVRILERRGGVVENVMLGRVLVIEDRELITAQDPTSAVDLGKQLLAKIEEYLASKKDQQSCRGNMD